MRESNQQNQDQCDSQDIKKKNFKPNSYNYPQQKKEKAYEKSRNRYLERLNNEQLKES